MAAILWEFVMPTRQTEQCIPMLDNTGNRVIVIRTTQYESVFRSIGPAEIEKQRRYTLPGKGHVTRLTDAEFEVFDGRIKLRLEEPDQMQ